MHETLLRSRETNIGSYIRQRIDYLHDKYVVDEEEGEEEDGSELDEDEAGNMTNEGAMDGGTGDERG